MKKNPYRFDNKLLFAYISVVITAWIFIKFYLLYWQLSDYFLIASFFILLLIQLYKDFIIPKVPKLIFLLLIVIITVFYNFSLNGNVNPFSTGLFLWCCYILTENHYNENIDNSNRYKNWKNNAKIIVIVIGGVFLSVILAYLLFSLFRLV